jgi:hypothetical protein
MKRLVDDCGSKIEQHPRKHLDMAEQRKIQHASTALRCIQAL